MKKPCLLLFLLTAWSHCLGQDGSDIRYYKVEAIDRSFIGKDVHFDFFQRSFRGQHLDTLDIVIDHKPVKFAEIRNDNGYTNWFSQQGLRSFETTDGLTLTISKLNIDSMTSTSFQVTMFVDAYDVNNKLLADQSRRIGYWFNKNDIVEVLVRSKQQ